MKPTHEVRLASQWFPCIRWGKMLIILHGGDSISLCPRINATELRKHREVVGEIVKKQIG